MTGLPALRLALLVLFIAAPCASLADAGLAPLPIPDPTTLDHKLILGFQGWFGCPADAVGRGWVHWKSGSALSVEMVPDVSELTPSELCPSALKTADDREVSFFTDQNARTVDRQFRWMRNYGIDGVALQRFATATLHPQTLASSNIVLANVRRAAEAEHRTFYITYDLSGMPPSQLQLVVEDWARLEETGLTRSSSYQQHGGHPVLGVWGLGFTGRPTTADQTQHLLKALRNASVDRAGITLIGGVPAGWRTGTGDASADGAWRRVWPTLDIISPWTVGRYADEASADRYRMQYLVPDLAYATSIGRAYMPVVFPGFSWSNLMTARGERQKAIFNQIPRHCGFFFWRQIVNARAAGATMLYGAMFDEVDEGTALFKLTTSATQTPVAPPTLTLDADRCRLPSDWYLTLSGAAADLFAGRRSLKMAMPSPPSR